MKINIVIHGRLKAVCPERITVHVDTPQQAVSFLLRSFHGMRQALRRGAYRFSLTSEAFSALLSEDSRFDTLLPDGVDTIHLVPVEGTYGKKFIGIVAGVLLIGVGVALTLTGIGGPIGGYLIGAGIGSLLGGIANLFTPVPKLGDLQQGDRPEERQSTLFTSPTNRLAKGVGVPVLYGRFYCGSNVMSQSIITEEVL